MHELAARCYPFADIAGCQPSCACLLLLQSHYQLEQRARLHPSSQFPGVMAGGAAVGAPPESEEEEDNPLSTLLAAAEAEEEEEQQQLQQQLLQQQLQQQQARSAVAAEAVAAVAAAAAAEVAGRGYCGLTAAAASVSDQQHHVLPALATLQQPRANSAFQACGGSEGNLFAAAVAAAASAVMPQPAAALLQGLLASGSVPPAALAAALLAQQQRQQQRQQQQRQQQLLASLTTLTQALPPAQLAGLCQLMQHADAAPVLPPQQPMPAAPLAAAVPRYQRIDSGTGSSGHPQPDGAAAATHSMIVIRSAPVEPLKQTPRKADALAARLAVEAVPVMYQPQQGDVQATSSAAGASSGTVLAGDVAAPGVKLDPGQPRVSWGGFPVTTGFSLNARGS